MQKREFGGALAPRLIDAKEVAYLLQCSPETARRLMREGDLKAIKMRGKLWRTTHALVCEYVRIEMECRSTARAEHLAIAS